MLKCLLFGLCVLWVLGLVPQGAKLFSSVKNTKRYFTVLLTVYLGTVVWLTLFNRIGMEVSRVRLKPFSVVRLLANCYAGKPTLPKNVCIRAVQNSQNLFDATHATPIEDLLLNIILFLPLGFLLPYRWPQLRGGQTVLIGFLLSLCIECTQYLGHWGCLDVDDIFNNTLGAVIGYGCFKIYQWLCRCSKKIVISAEK